MYKIGELIIYSGAGVCRVEGIGPLTIKGTWKDVSYYTLAPVYGSGSIYVPVQTDAYMRPIMTRGEAEEFIARIPDAPVEIYENSNPRQVSEYYRTYFKSHDAANLLYLIRGIYAKRRQSAEKGKKLGQTDENMMEQAEKALHEELAAALGISPEEVKGYIRQTLQKQKKADDTSPSA